MHKTCEVKLPHWPRKQAIIDDIYGQLQKPKVYANVHTDQI